MLIPVRSTALVPRWLAGDGHYTRGASRRTWTRSSRTPTPPGAAANAVSSSGLRSRSSWATIGASASTTSANPSSWSTRHAAGRGGDPFRDDRLEGRDRARQPELVLEPERACRVGHQVADPRHRPAPACHEATPAPPTRPAPSGSARTSQWWAIARRAGSRSSRVVVVTNAWGRAAIRRTRCDRRSGSSSENTSSSRSSGGRPSRAVRRSSSASLKARIAVRCWPRDANAARSRPASSNDDVVAVRPDERRAVPDLLLGRLDEPPRERVPRRLPGECRRVRHVAHRERRLGTLVRSDLGMGGSQGLAERLEEAQALGHDRRRRRRGTRRPRSAARRATQLPRGSPAAGCCAAGAPARRSRARRRRRPSGWTRAGRSPPAAGSASRPRGASPPARRRRPGAGVARLVARRPTPLTRIRLRPPLPVAPERTTPTSMTSRPRRALDPRHVGGPADQLAVRRGPVRAAPGEQDDRLEQARLAGGVRSPDQLRPGPERDLERVVATEVRARSQHGMRRARPTARPDAILQDVVRTGMTTWT